MVTEVKAMACEPPEQRGAPLSRWSSAELAARAVAEGLVGAVSASSVRRWLGEDSIKPWRHRSWSFPRDPDFRAEAARVLNLYARGCGTASSSAPMTMPQSTDEMAGVSVP